MHLFFNHQARLSYNYFLIYFLLIKVKLRLRTHHQNVEAVLSLYEGIMVKACYIASLYLYHFFFLSCDVFLHICSKFIMTIKMSINVTNTWGWVLSMYCVSRSWIC